MTQTPATPGGATPPSTTQTSSATPPPSQSATPATWDEWLAAQPEAQRAVIADLHSKKVQTLEGTLTKERDDRKKLEKDLREMAGKAEAGSDAQNKLTAMADQVAVSDRRADFYEAAAKPEVGLVDIKAAWLIANAEPNVYFDKRGNLQIDQLKKDHPALFAQPKPAPRANAGNGTQNADGSGAVSMNDFIRRAAGRQ